MATQYRVINAGSCEPLTDWVDTEAEAHTLAEEIEQHESEPECKIVTREVQILKLPDTRYENAEIVAAYDTTTQEIVDIVTVDGQVACADVLRVQAAVLGPQPAVDEGVKAIEYVYCEAGLARQPGGVVVSIQNGRYHVADDHHCEYYGTVGEAVADVESWRS
jgi:hypothetical protein